jgi:hypothetical protein
MNPGLARHTSLQALQSAGAGGRFASDMLRSVAEAVCGAPQPDDAPPAIDLLVTGPAAGFRGDEAHVPSRRPTMPSRSSISKRSIALAAAASRRNWLAPISLLTVERAALCGHASSTTRRGTALAQLNRGFGHVAPFAEAAM